MVCVERPCELQGSRGRQGPREPGAGSPWTPQLYLLWPKCNFWGRFRSFLKAIPAAERMRPAVVLIEFRARVRKRGKTSPKSYTLPSRPHLSALPIKKRARRFPVGPASLSHVSCGDVSEALSREQGPDTCKLIAAATPAANMTPSTKKTIASYTCDHPPRSTQEPSARASHESRRTRCPCS